MLLSRPPHLQAPSPARARHAGDAWGKLGTDGADMTIEQFAAFQKAEVAKWAAVTQVASIKLE